MFSLWVGQLAQPISQGPSKLWCHGWILRGRWRSTCLWNMDTLFGRISHFFRRSLVYCYFYLLVYPFRWVYCTLVDNFSHNIIKHLTWLGTGSHELFADPGRHLAMFQFHLNAFQWNLLSTSMHGHYQITSPLIIVSLPIIWNWFCYHNKCVMTTWLFFWGWYGIGLIISLQN